MSESTTGGPATSPDEPAMKGWFGVYPTHVVDVLDPAGQGRVKISLPPPLVDPSNPVEAWARLATLMAGNDRGTWFIPDMGDEVLVAFEAGQLDSPYVIGALWNGADRPTESMDGANARRSITSRNGIKVVLEDIDGSETFSVETPGGQRITLGDGPGRLAIEDSNGNLIHLEPDGVRIAASAKVSIEASSIELSAGMVTVSAGMTTFSGAIKADSLIANSVVASSYTPGAGNIW